MEDRRVLTYRQYFNMDGSEFKPGDVIHASVVMVIGQHGKDYAVYVAPDETWTPEEIAKNGDKLRDQEDVAKALFGTAAWERFARR